MKNAAAIKSKTMSCAQSETTVFVLATAAMFTVLRGNPARRAG